MRNMINSLMTCFVAIALIAAPLDTYAQTRGGGGGGSHSSSSASRGGGSSAGRSSGSSMSSRGGGSSMRSSSPQTRSSSSSMGRSSQSSRGSYSSPSSRVQGLSPATGSQNRSSASPSTRSSVGGPSRQGSSAARSNSNPSTRSSVGGPSRQGSTASRAGSNPSTAGRSGVQGQPATRSGAAQGGNASRNFQPGGSSHPANVVSRENGRDFMRIDTHRDVYRVTPRMREPMRYTEIHHFYDPGFHYFGHRIFDLPIGYHHIFNWGLDYYFYDGVYYRMWDDMYYVCRPPFGTVFDFAADLAFTAVNFAYYNNLYRTYNRIDDNYATIDEQNKIIAQNNATIAQQNSQIALNTTRANSSYTLANGLGLFQSYANANQQYYYNDGVFYILNANNQYEVIVPPAGALVDALPDDYDLITINGVEYYLVDTTVFRSTIIDGAPKLEVLGQMSQADADRYHKNAESTSSSTLM